MAWGHVLKAYLETYPCFMRGCSFNNNGKCNIIENAKSDVSLENYLNHKCDIIQALKIDDYYFFMAHQTIDGAPLLISSDKKFERNLAKSLLKDK